MTDTKQIDPPFRGTVYYDADCRICRGLLDRWGDRLRRQGFVFRPLTEGMLRPDLPFPPEEFAEEMKLEDTRGAWHGGADAMLILFQRVWWLAPLAWLGRLPGLNHLAHFLYRQVAANRHCLGGFCAVPPKRPSDRWLPLVVLPLLVLGAGSTWAPWILMWALAFALYFGCKWLTLREATSRLTPPPPVRDQAGYLLLWPGMDGHTFFRPQNPPHPIPDHWFSAIGLTLTGAFFLLFWVPRWPESQALIQGWTAMVGVVLFLHFGLFHLLALAWQKRGRGAMALMQNPPLAGRLSEFWGRRWNLAFHDLTYTYLVQPLRRKIGAAGAILTGFFLSGLIHELVITVPARGGYGGPTLYFLLQGIFFLIERHPLLRSRPGLVRLMMWVVLLLPLPLLFPPVFVHNVILPMLEAWGLR